MTPDSSPLSNLRAWLKQPQAGLQLALWAGAVLLTAALLGYLLWPRPAPQRQIRAFFSLTPDQVFGVELDGPKEHIVLKRSDQGWRLVEPVDDQVNTQTVFALLADLCDWQALQVAADAGQQPWEAGTQGWRITLRDQAGRAWTVQVGRKQEDTGQYYARRADDEQIYLVRLPEELIKPAWAQRLRNRVLFDEPLADIRQITFREAHAAMTLARETAAPSIQELPQFGKRPSARVSSAPAAEPRWVITHPFYVPADSEVAAEVATAVSQWEVEACVEESVGARTDLGKYGLTEPYAAVVLQQSPRRFPVELIFGQPEGVAGPLYLKSSLEAKIFRLAPGQLERLQELLNHVASRRLVFFWREVGECEITTAGWRITLKREPNGWQAVSVRVLEPEVGAGPLKMKPTEEPEPYFFKAAPVAEKLERLEYLEVLTDQHPLAGDFRQAVRAMHIRFFSPTGSLLEDFALLERPRAEGPYFLQRQNDDLIYLVGRTEIKALLAKALPAKK